MLTCAHDSGAMTDCQPACSAPATEAVTMRLHTGRTYASALCARHARLREWNAGCPSDHVVTVPLGRT